MDNNFERSDHKTKESKASANTISATSDYIQGEQLSPPVLEFKKEEKSNNSAKNSPLQNNSTSNPAPQVDNSNSHIPFQLKEDEDKQDSNEEVSNAYQFDASGDDPNELNKNSAKTFQLKEDNNTTSTSNNRSNGLPFQLRKNMESLSGYDLSDVAVHKNSSKPKQFKALAYAQGSEIHLGPGQEKHLPHEAWHVVQQQKGLVSQTTQYQGAKINDDRGLEREADIMGNKATQMKWDPSSSNQKGETHSSQLKSGIIQNKSSEIIQKTDDATVESGTGVGTAIADGSMVQEGFMNSIYDNERPNDYKIEFKFSKAYKGTFPYRENMEIKGVYVKIEATFTDLTDGNRCTRLELLQVLRNVRQGDNGMEAADPGNDTRRERSGWGDENSASRGWRVDRTSGATDPFYSNSWVGQPGDATTPAILWDTPGDLATSTNAGKDFYTSAVCTDSSGRKWVAGSVHWGYYINESGDISFNPATPVSMVGNPQQTQDAAERWDSIEGNTDTGVTF